MGGVEGGVRGGTGSRFTCHEVRCFCGSPIHGRVREFVYNIRRCSLKMRSAVQGGEIYGGRNGAVRDKTGLHAVVRLSLHINATFCVLASKRIQQNAECMHHWAMFDPAST